MFMAAKVNYWMKALGRVPFGLWRNFWFLLLLIFPSAEYFALDSVRDWENKIYLWQNMYKPILLILFWVVYANWNGNSKKATKKPIIQFPCSILQSSEIQILFTTNPPTNLIAIWIYLKLFSYWNNCNYLPKAKIHSCHYPWFCSGGDCFFTDQQWRSYFVYQIPMAEFIY